MQFSRIAAWLFAAAVLGAWFASAAGVSRTMRVPRTAPRSQETVAVQHLAADVQAQAARLRQRLEHAPVPKAPFRNPFTFSARPAPARVTPRAAEPVVTPLPPAPAPAEPGLELIGVAEKNVGDGVVRTAMLTIADGDNLIMATVGQKILGAYEVVAIGADAVELKDVVTGATRRLVMKRP